jgi:hypothetical protein
MLNITGLDFSNMAVFLDKDRTMDNVQKHKRG